MHYCTLGSNSRASSIEFFFFAQWAKPKRHSTPLCTVNQTQATLQHLFYIFKPNNEIEHTQFNYSLCRHFILMASFLVVKLFLSSVVWICKILDQNNQPFLVMMRSYKKINKINFCHFKHKWRSRNHVGFDLDQNNKFWIPQNCFFIRVLEQWHFRAGQRLNYDEK